MLYDQEIYIIKFREYDLNDQGPEQKLTFTTGDISEKQTLNKNKFDKKKLGRENTLDVSIKSMKSSTGEKTTTNTSIFKRERIIKSINEVKKLNYYNFINIIIISLLFIILVIYIVILVYQNTNIDISHKIFI